MPFEALKHSLWADAIRRLRRNRLALLCFGIICLYFLTALATKMGFLFPNVGATDNSNAYLPPSSINPLGTDLFGREVLAKAVHGARTAISVGFVAASIAITVGVFFGALSGYFGGLVDDIIVWLYTTVDSIPSILLLISFAYVLGQGIINAYIAIGLTSWVSLCRIIRGEFMKNKGKEYVVAAHALGASHIRRMFLHILPNTFHIILIQFSLGFVYAIKSEVILSYLGLGVETGQFSWGLMIDDAKQELVRGVWWQLAAAGLSMFGLVLAFNLFNDALREALDPKLKNK